MRVLALAFFSVGGAVWALLHYYAHPHAPMMVAVPKAAPTFDADAGETEVPEELLEAIPSHAAEPVSAPR